MQVAARSSPNAIIARESYTYNGNFGWHIGMVEWNYSVIRPFCWFKIPKGIKLKFDNFFCIQYEFMTPKKKYIFTLLINYPLRHFLPEQKSRSKLVCCVCLAMVLVWGCQNWFNHLGFPWRLNLSCRSGVLRPPTLESLFEWFPVCYKNFPFISSLATLQIQ